MNANSALNQAWADHIEKWRASGLSIKAFCEQEGLVYHQFSYWRQKFSPSTNSTTGSKLVPVSLATPFMPSSNLEILLPNGMIIRGVSLVSHLVAAL
ncbi:IS66 family insertion sequence element accessory protein TnpA [Marinomonas fungiae]|uniref:Transposase n=1 Tax=Marinomonas fungiae TaxID=1137284 RepID=A0A0K6IUU7_9GAMM|nr:hypothetical protein [Marinomonas fungiae]CUB06873.1 hypothetical protein Ga0061065_12416 [Marinomonas fungiae]